MREWFWPMLPVTAIVYFAFRPDQFTAFIVWAERFVH